MDRMDLDNDSQSSPEPLMPPRPPDNLFASNTPARCPYFAQSLLQQVPLPSLPSAPWFHGQSRNQSLNQDQSQSQDRNQNQDQGQNQNQDSFESALLARTQTLEQQRQRELQQQHQQAVQLQQRLQYQQEQQRQYVLQQTQQFYQQIAHNQSSQRNQYFVQHVQSQQQQQQQQQHTRQPNSPPVPPHAQPTAQNSISPQVTSSQRPATSLPPPVSPDSPPSRAAYTPIYVGAWPLAESGFGSVYPQYSASAPRHLHDLNHGLSGFHHSSHHSGSRSSSGAPFSGAPPAGVNPQQQAQQPTSTMNVTATITLSPPPAGPTHHVEQTQASTSAANGPSPEDRTALSSSASPTDSATDLATPAPLGSIRVAPAPAAQASVRTDGSQSATRSHTGGIRRETRHVPYDDSSSDDSETGTRPRYGPAFNSAAAREAYARSNAAMFFQEVIDSRRGSGVTKTTIRSLESIKVDSLDEDERMCIICYVTFGEKSFEGVVESPLKLPKCKHVFGNRCITKWLKENRTCPYCRDELEPPRQIRFSTARRNVYAGEDRLRYTDYPRAQAPRQVGSGHSSSSSNARHASGYPPGPMSSTASRPSGVPSATRSSGFSGFGNLRRADLRRAELQRAAAERTGERRAAPDSESADGPTRRVRIRVENSLLGLVSSPPTPTVTDTPSSSTSDPVRFNSNNSSLQPPASVSMTSSFQISTCPVQSSRPAASGTAQQSPSQLPQTSQPSGHQQPIRDHRSYGAFSSPLSFSRSTPQTANGNTTPANGNNTGNTNASVAAINSARDATARSFERAASTAWNRQLLPLPNTTTSTSVSSASPPSSTLSVTLSTTTTPSNLSSDASRPIITSPFDHQIPPAFRRMPNMYSSVYHTPNMPHTAVSAATASAGPSPMPTMSPNSTTLPPLGPIRNDPFIPHVTDPANYGNNSDSW